MRISDWSSDVCSSDLVEGLQDVSISVDEINGKIVGILAQLDLTAIEAVAVGRSNVAVDEHRLADPACRIRQTRTGHRAGPILKCFRNISEAHTSGLQSLLLISYDVFVLQITTLSLISK